MKTYLIREMDDNSGKIMGSAVVHDIADLWQTMDEFANPHDYEYLRVTDTIVTFALAEGIAANELAHEQMPPTDDDLAAGCAARKGRKWKTMVDLCGGQEQFREMYYQIYGVEA